MGRLRLCRPLVAGEPLAWRERLQAAFGRSRGDAVDAVANNTYPLRVGLFLQQVGRPSPLQHVPAKDGRPSPTRREAVILGGARRP